MEGFNDVGSWEAPPIIFEAPPRGNVDPGALKALGL